MLRLIDPDKDTIFSRLPLDDMHKLITSGHLLVMPEGLRNFYIIEHTIDVKDGALLSIIVVPTDRPAPWNVMTIRRGSAPNKLRSVFSSVYAGRLKERTWPSSVHPTDGTLIHECNHTLGGCNRVIYSDGGTYSSKLAADLRNLWDTAAEFILYSIEQQEDCEI